MRRRIREMLSLANTLLRNGPCIGKQKQRLRRLALDDFGIYGHGT
jgi:hypothetical protein